MIADQLKKAVLQAAIQGKLTQQLPEDGDAHELLSDIKREKARLIEEGKIKKQKPLPEVTEDEFPFDIPENWVWVVLGNITSILGDGLHGTPIYNDQGKYKFINGNNLSDGQIIFTENTKNLDESEYLKYKKPLNETTVLVSINGTLGNVGFYKDERIILGKSACYFNLLGDISKKYLKYIVNSDYFTKYAFDKATGSTIKNVSLQAMRTFPIPLPTLSEQQRIVQNLDQVIPELDILAKDETKLEELQKSFPSKMKSSILQAAIKGKLTEQLPADGDARDLLAEIQTEKSRLIQEGKIKKEKPLPEITEDEIPFDIPDNWYWVRLGEISFDHGQKRPDRPFTYIDISSIDNIGNKLSNLSQILQPENAPSRARKIVQKGDVIYATVRPYLHNICIIDKIIDPEPIVSTGFAVITSINADINRYLFYCFLSPMFDAYVNDSDNTKGVAYPAINNEKLSKAIIPLAPLAEQQRIVSRLSELLPLCDTLE